MGINNDDLVERVVKFASKDEVMAQYNDKFDEPYERAKRLGRVGDLTQLTPAGKVIESTTAVAFRRRMGIMMRQ